jgi:hypothetical protein
MAARTRTLTNIIADVRLRADNQALADADITEFINQSIADFTDMLIVNDAAAYFEKSVTFNTTPNVDTVSIFTVASDFYKLVGLWWQISQSPGSGMWAPMRRYTQVESEISFPTAGWLLGGNVTYNIEGQNIRFVPTPLSAQAVKLKYVPYAVRLVIGSDTFDGVNGWEEWVIVDAVLKCLEREGADPQELAAHTARRDRKEQRILEALARDQGEPPRVQDVVAARNSWWGRY